MVLFVLWAHLLIRRGVLDLICRTGMPSVLILMSSSASLIVNVSISCIGLEDGMQNRSVLVCYREVFMSGVCYR